MEDRRVLELQVSDSKIVLFMMWKRVEDGIEDSRSFMGDLALDFRGVLYPECDGGDYVRFAEEYCNWKSRYKPVEYPYDIKEAGRVSRELHKIPIADLLTEKEIDSDSE